MKRLPELEPNNLSLDQFAHRHKSLVMPQIGFLHTIQQRFTRSSIIYQIDAVTSTIYQKKSFVSIFASAYRGTN